ncbi:MAG: glycosyltransferase family 4 protein, partial [Opitutales bacterium]
AQALKLAGAQFHLNYAGGGKSLEAFRQRTAEMNLADCVTFHGFVSDEKLAELYQEADIFALPSSGEGFGLVYLEAMARGLPCIASTAGAATEVVLDGECGRCIPNGDVTALTAALHELVQHPELRRRLGEAGRQRYLQHFTETAFTVRFQALLERLLAG